MPFFLLPRGLVLVARGVGLRPLPKGAVVASFGWRVKESWGGCVCGASGWGALCCVEVCCAAWRRGCVVLGDGGGSGGGPWRRWAWTVLGGSVELGRSWSAGGLTLRGACCALLGGCSNFALRFARAWYDLGMALERAS